MKKLYWIIGSVSLSIIGLVGSYHLGSTNATKALLEALEMVCTRGGVMQFPDGRLAACFPVTDNPYEQKKMHKGLDKSYEV